MTTRGSPSRGWAAAQSEARALAALLGLRPFGDDQEELVRAIQLRAADRMGVMRTTVALILIGFVDLLFMRHSSMTVLLGWTVLALATRVPQIRLQRRHVRATDRAVTRRSIRLHALVCLLQGMVWAVPSIVFADQAAPAEMIGLWTLSSCFMTAAAIAFHSMPLSAFATLLPIGGASVWMMTQQDDPLLTAVVATYSLILLVAGLRQAHQFGEQLSTSSLLAENQEVVSLLLKEHEIEGGDWLWQTDADGRLKDVSPSVARMFGWSAEALEGVLLTDIVGEGARKAGKPDPAQRRLAELLGAHVAFSDFVLPIQVEGELRWLEVSASPRLDEKGVFLGYRGVGSDITARRESAERIAQLARHDTLTNLPNRLFLTEGLTEAVDAVERRGGRCAVLMIDLDRFKIVNDTLGHQIGDELLMQVSARLRQVCADGEIVGRLGGDEFAVLIPDLAEDADIERVAGAIIDAVSRPYLVDRYVLNVGASIGSAIAPDDARTVTGLLRGADLAMYRAKEAGGNRHFRFVPAMQADIEERRMLETALRDALVQDELHLAFQPMVDAATGTITGMEALARWTHPALGPIAPARFIPIAEEARLIGPIGDWVLRNACMEAMRWPDEVGIAVNISTEQLRDREFLETVVSALAHSGLPARRLSLEVTESVFLRERGAAIPLIDRLLKLGVSIVLDDFGTGHSSIGYFARTRFAALKIDRPFVVGAARGQVESLAIVRAAVAMAETLGIHIIAEGVESEGEYERARSLGFSRIQGYYCDRPMPAREAFDLFGDRDSRVA